jgi:hypothetical protein
MIKFVFDDDVASSLRLFLRFFGGVAALRVRVYTHEYKQLRPPDIKKRLRD